MNYLETFQLRFKSGFWVEMALINLVDDLYQNLDEHVSLLIDLPAASAIIDHGVFLNCLSCLEIGACFMTFGLFQTAVICNQCLSCWKLKCRVFQDSIKPPYYLKSRWNCWQKVIWWFRVFKFWDVVSKVLKWRSLFPVLCWKQKFLNRNSHYVKMKNYLHI